MGKGGIINLGENDATLGIADGEWKVDENGRRYRMVGKAKEYEMMVSINGYEVPQSMVSEYHKHKAKKSPSPATPTTTNRICPFKISKNGIDTNCSKNCVFYEDGCIFTKGDAPSKDTTGSYCPIARKCNEKCAMYNHGCTLISVISTVFRKEK